MLPANYDRALERLRAAVDLDDNLWEAWYDQGWIALRQRQPQAAVAPLEKALAIWPSHAPTVTALGEAYVALGRAGDAAHAYRAWLDKHPTGGASDGLRVALGAALRKANQLDDAIEALRQALRQAPRSTEALNQLALVYQSRRQLELADLVLHRALDIDDKSKASAATWNNLGLVALARRRDQEAFAHFDQAARLDPSLTVARRNKAVVYLDCGDYARAAEELRHVTRADEADVDAWVALGVAERGRGQLEAAARAYEHALDLAPTAADALFDLGVLLMDFRKEKDAAREKLEAFLKAAPSSHSKRQMAESRLAELAPRPPPKDRAAPKDVAPKAAPAPQSK
jgi:tetratricopeptide (TPR) repeat protein